MGLAVNRWGKVGAGDNHYRYNGKEQVDEIGLYDYGAMWYDPAVARWGQVDPLVDKFSSYSPYNYVLNNPTNAIDPDGRDVILLINSQAPFGTGASGHGAVLIGNDQSGWTLFSKSGGNHPNGKAIVHKATFSSQQDFQDSYGKSRSYSYGYRVKTTQQQDATMLQTADTDAPTPYTWKNNCADLCRNVIESGGDRDGRSSKKIWRNLPLCRVP